MREPLAVAAEARSASRDKDAWGKNCFLEKRQGGQVVATRRPGTELFGTAGSFGQGLFNYNGNAYAVSNDTLYGEGVLGVTWTNTASTDFPGAFTNYYSNGTVLVATEGSVTWYSTDGAAWVDSGSSTIVEGVIAGVFIGSDGSSSLQISLTGASWSNYGALPGWPVTSADPFFFIQNTVTGDWYAYDVATMEYYVSTNSGVSWGAATAIDPTLTGPSAFYFFAGKYIALENNSLWVSTTPDFSTAAVELTLSNLISLSEVSGVLYAYANHVAASYNRVATYHSTDALTWTASSANSLISGGAFGATAFNLVGAVFNDALWLYSITGKYSTSSATFSPVVTPVPTTPSLQFQFVLTDVAAGTSGFFFKSTADAYYFNGTTVTHVTDVDYPATTVYGAVFLDGTYYVMDANARIHGSDINNPLSWSALNVIEAQIEPDGGVALARQLNYIVAFGAYTTEFFYDAGNPTGSPLLPYTSAMLKIGCATAGSIAQTVNTLFFMGVAQQKGRGIYKLEGTQPTYISNAVIDRILNADDLATVYSFCIRISGHNFYVLTLSTSNITLAYDDMTGDWKEWTSLTAGTVLSSVTLAYADQTVTATKAAHGLSDGSIATIAGASPAAYNGTFVVNYIDSSHFSYVPASTPASTPATGTITATPYTEGKFIGRNYTGFGVWDLVQDVSGNLYSVSTDSTTDNGLPISVLIRTKLLDGQNNKFKYFTQAQIIGDRVSEVASVRYTNDDYQTWSAYRQVDLSLARPQVYRLGRARRRAFELKYIGDSAMRFEAIELTAEEGVR